MSQVSPLQIVVSEDEKLVVRLAAARQGKTVSAFGRELLLREAREVLVSFFADGGSLVNSLIEATETEAA